MSTFEALAIGDTFTTPSITLDAERVANIVAAGGYTHPLFTDPAFAAASPFGRTPVPGEGLLLVMGGLIEQTDRFDETTIALTGFDSVRFVAAAFIGDTVHVVAEVLAKEPSKKTGTIVFAWRCFMDDELLVDAAARMLFRLPA